MFDFFDKERWKTLYNEDYLPKIKLAEKALNENNIEEIEYWYIVLYSSAFNLIKHYLYTKGYKYFKNKDLLTQAIKFDIITDEACWLEAIKISDRIGRAVQSKEENFINIKEILHIYHSLADTFAAMAEKDTEKENVK